jgi:hypothetical protein
MIKWVQWTHQFGEGRKSVLRGRRCRLDIEKKGEKTHKHKQIDKENLYSSALFSDWSVRIAHLTQISTEFLFMSRNTKEREKKKRNFMTTHLKRTKPKVAVVTR